VLPGHVLNPNPEVYLSENFVVADFETSNFDKGSALDGRNRLLLATWISSQEHNSSHGGNRVRVRSCSGELSEFGRLVDALEKADFIVAHNAKFELQWLARYGVDISRFVVWDTMLGEYVRLGNRLGPKDLDSVLKRYGIPRKRGLVSAFIQGGVCPSEIPERWLVEYGKWDTEATYYAFLKQRAELQELGLLSVLYTRCLATPVLADIEANGVAPDPSRVAEAIRGTRQDHSALDRRLAEVTGGINLRSPKQVAEYLYDNLGFGELVGIDGDPSRTATGGRRTDAEAIGALRATTPAQKEFKEIYGRFRILDKQLEILGKLQAVVEDGGILYAQYNQAVTRNHRLSSSGRKFKLQFQNFPRDFKRLFKARKDGWLVGEADGAQLEFRVAAHLGRDARAASDIRSGYDVHRGTASALFGVPFDEVTKEQRQDAKPETFRPLYGSKGNSEATKRYARAFSARWPDIHRTQQGWTLRVLQDKQLRIESGLIFYWPDTTISRYGYIKHTTEIFNYPVSSLATADIIPIGLVYAWHRLRACNAETFITNTIHDSIIAEVHPEEVKLFADTVKQAMTYDTLAYLKKVYGIDYTVPLGVEIKVGTHWGTASANDEKFEVDPQREAA
jgi:DNA polymerase-1